MQVARLVAVYPQLNMADKYRNKAVSYAIKILCVRMVKARMIQENEAQQICLIMGLKI